jgi:carboxyl-terminal processing protease
MSGVLVGERLDAQPGTPTSRADQFQPFWDTYQAIEDRYAGGDVDQQALIRGAIRGMVEALDDPYSAYLTPEEYQSGLQDLSGQFEGIGAEIGTKSPTGATSECATLGADCALIVVSPIDGSPAQKAGLLAATRFLKVDGAALDGLTVDAARDKVRGKKGTTVVLTISRGSAEPFDVSIVRDVIVQKEVITKDLAGGAVGYIHVTGFSDNSASQFHDALKADLDAGKTKIILDLRGNPGGYVTAARRIASEFIGSGPIFWEEDAQGQQVETDASSGGSPRPTRSSSSSSSTRAAHRRARSSRARSRTATGPSSSGTRRSARARSSSGSSSRTTARSS